MANVGTHKHKTTELYGLPTDWLLTIPRGIPPPTWWWGDKCGPAGTALFGDGRRPTAAAAAAATAAAAAATEELGGGGGGARAAATAAAAAAADGPPTAVLPKLVVLWGPSCGVVLCAR